MKHRYSLVYKKLYEESGGNILIIKSRLPKIMKATLKCYNSDCSMCRRQYCLWWIWLVGYFGFGGPLRQYFSLYGAVSQREGEREEKGQRRVKMSKQPPPAPTASAICPCPINQIGGTGSLPRTIAPPDHPTSVVEMLIQTGGLARQLSIQPASATCKWRRVT